MKKFSITLKLKPRLEDYLQLLNLYILYIEDITENGDEVDTFYTVIHLYNNMNPFVNTEFSKLKPFFQKYNRIAYCYALYTKCVEPDLIEILGDSKYRERYLKWFKEQYKLSVKDYDEFLEYAKYLRTIQKSF